VSEARAIITGSTSYANAVLRVADARRDRARRVTRRCMRINMGSGLLYPAAICLGFSPLFVGLCCVILVSTVVMITADSDQQFALDLGDDARAELRRLAFCAEHEGKP
jgi:hypothetical protein